MINLALEYFFENDIKYVSSASCRFLSCTNFVGHFTFKFALQLDYCSYSHCLRCSFQCRLDICTFIRFNSLEKQYYLNTGNKLLSMGNYISKSSLSPVYSTIPKLRKKKKLLHFLAFENNKLGQASKQLSRALLSFQAS